MDTPWRRRSHLVYIVAGTLAGALMIAMGYWRAAIAVYTTPTVTYCPAAGPGGDTPGTKHGFFLFNP